MALSVVATSVIGDGPARPHRDMLYEAVRDVLDRSGLKRSHLDVGVTVSSDLAEGRGLSNQFVLDSIAGVMRPFDLRVSGESLLAVGAAASHLLSGTGRTAIVAGVLRCSDLRGGEMGLGRLLLTRLDHSFEQPVLPPFAGSLRRIIGEMIEREAGGLSPGIPPPSRDVAVAVLLRRDDDPHGVVLRSIAWHTSPGWTLSAYRRSIEGAAAETWRRLGRRPEFAHVHLPEYPPALARVSREVLGFADIEDSCVSAPNDGAPSSFLLDGLAQFSTAAEELRSASVGSASMVQSWQGPGASGVCIAVLERAAGA